MKEKVLSKAINSIQSPKANQESGRVNAEYYMQGHGKGAVQRLGRWKVKSEPQRLKRTAERNEKPRIPSFQSVNLQKTKNREKSHTRPPRVSSGGTRPGRRKGKDFS